MNSPRHNATHQHHSTTTNSKCRVTRTATTPGTATTATTAATHNTKQQQQQLFHQAASQNTPSPASMPAPAHKKQGYKQQEQHPQQKITSHGMDTLSQRQVTQGLRLLVPNSKNARPSRQNRVGPSITRTATTKTSKNNIYTAATMTRTAATTATFPVVPQYSNLANHRAPTTARTAPATAQQTQLLNQVRETNSPFVSKKEKRKMRTQEGLPTDASGHDPVFGVSWRPPPCSCAGHVLEKLVPQGGSGLLIAARQAFVLMCFQSGLRCSPAPSATQGRAGRR